MTNLKRLHKELAALWLLKSLEKWGNQCIICGETAIQMHHYEPRSMSLFLRYNVENAVPLCKSCHYKIHFSHRPNEIKELCNIICKKRGKKWYKYIEAGKRQEAKNAIWWLQVQKEKLEEL